MSNSVDTDETAHMHLCCLQKPIIIACGSEGVKQCSCDFYYATIQGLPYTIFDSELDQIKVSKQIAKMANVGIQHGI